MREIVLDTETTGFEPTEGDRIVEIGAVELFNHMPTGRTYHQYINPERSMPKAAFEVHGLGDDFLRDKPVFKDIAQAFLDFVGSEQTMALGASLCRVLGDFTIVGIAGGVLPFSFFSIPYETSLQTTYWGSRVELAEVLDLAAHHLITPKISKFNLLNKI